MKSSRVKLAEGWVVLRVKKSMIVGLGNGQSHAYRCAQVFRRAGAGLVITYLDMKADLSVRPQAERLQSPIVMPRDGREPGQLEAAFLVSDAAPRLTGNTEYIAAGCHILG